MHLKSAGQTVFIFLLRSVRSSVSALMENGNLVYLVTGSFKVWNMSGVDPDFETAS